MRKVDARSYNEGKRAWKRGNSLLALVEMAEPTEEQQKDPNFNFTEYQNNHMSLCLGFADAALEWLRGGMRK